MAIAAMRPASSSNGLSGWDADGGDAGAAAAATAEVDGELAAVDSGVAGWLVCDVPAWVVCCTGG